MKTSVNVAMGVSTVRFSTTESGWDSVLIEIYPLQGDLRLVKVTMSVNCEEYFLVSREVKMNLRSVERLIEVLHLLWSNGQNIVRESDIPLDRTSFLSLI